MAAVKLKDDLGYAARGLYFLFGVVLAAATVASVYHEWPRVTTGKESPLMFLLPALVGLMLALFIILWSAIGRHREWRIADDHVRVRLLSLTSWQRDFRIHPEEIESLARDAYSYDDRSARVAHGLSVTLRDGRVLRSPHTFDARAAEAAWQKLQALRSRGQYVTSDPDDAPAG